MTGPLRSRSEMAADLALLPEGRDSWAGWYAALRLAGDVEPLLRALDAAARRLATAHAEVAAQQQRLASLFDLDSHTQETPCAECVLGERIYSRQKARERRERRRHQLDQSAVESRQGRSA